MTSPSGGKAVPGRSQAEDGAADGNAKGHPGTALGNEATGDANECRTGESGDDACRGPP